MQETEKLSTLHEEISDNSLDIIGVLEGLMMISEDNRPTCTLLEIAKEKSVNILKKSERIRKILG